MGLLNDAAVVNIEGNTKQLVEQINKADKAMQNFDKTLTDILNHLTAVESGLKNVNGVTNNFNKNYKGNFFTSATNAFGGVRGSAANYTSTRSKGYKEAQDAYIRLQNEEIAVLQAQIEKDKKIAKLKDEQANQLANEIAVRRINANAKYKKSEYLNSAQHLSYEAGLGLKHQKLQGFYDYKSAHPERFLAGALNYSFAHQGARALSGIGNSAKSLGVGGKVIGGVLDTAASFLKAPAAGIMAIFKNLGQGMIDLGKDATQAYAEIEAIKTQLGVVFSNQTQANSMFGEISQYAVHSPFGVQQTSELAVLLKQSGVYASDLMDTLKMLGDTAGGNMEKMKRIANNYAQIVSIGKASMLDMRQFAYAGIPIFEAVSKELGVSQQELRKLISEGKVTSDIVEKVFKDLTGINGIFENATEKGAKTLKARLQNLSDARQLAFGEIGSSIVNFGTRTGGDSYVNKLVTLAEQVYEHLKTEVSTKNIEKNVEVIATRNSDIERYKNLIEFAKASGMKSLEDAFTAKLKQELAKLNPDEARSVYVQSYKNKTRGFGLLGENDVTGTAASIQKEVDELYERIKELNVRYWSQEEINSVGGDKIYAFLRKQDAEAGNLLGDARQGSTERFQADALQERAKVLEEILDALKDYNNISDELRRAIKEDNMIQAQQLQFDITNRNADASTSLNASFNELASILENSEDYKQKEEEKRLKILKDAQDELRKIAEKADEAGNLNFTEFDRKEFQRLNKAGAFNATKLDIVQGNKTLTAENRAQLESQFASAGGKVMEELANSMVGNTVMGKEAMKEFQEKFFGLANITDDEEFFRQFGSALNDITNSLKQLEDFNPADREWLQDLQKYLIQSTNKYEARVKGVNADLTQENKGKELPDYIPLWKRIVASDTGWSAERITTAKEFMKEYQKYSAQQIARGGIQGLAMAGGRAGEIGTMLSYTGAINKQGVHQVDWEKTQQNIYDYANSLETPLKKAAGTMKGLADAMQGQVDVYRKLTADIYTVGEDWTTINNDIKGQYSVAQGLGNADILDNAFEAMAKNNDKFKIAFDEEQGLVVFDKMSNSIVGSIEDLKTSNEISDASLKEFLKDIKVDNLVTAIDKASKATEAQAAVIQVNSDMLEEANKLAQERATDTAKAVGSSYSIILGALKNRGVENADLLSSRSDTGANFAASTKVTQAFASIFEKIVTSDNIYNLVEGKNADKEIQGVASENKNAVAALIQLRGLFDKGASVENFTEAVQYFIQQFPKASKKIVEEATDTAIAVENNAMLSAADNALTNSYFSIGSAINGNWHKGTNFEHTIMSRYGVQDYNFDKFSKDLTESVFANPSGASSQQILDLYKSNILKAVKQNGKEGDVDNIQSLIDSGDWNSVETALEDIGDGKIWQTAIEGANKMALSLGNVGQSLSDIMDKMADLGVNFMGDAITTTFQTWGEALGKGSDASKDIAENLKSLAASTMQNMGAMITQAGLSLAVSSWGDKGGVLAGLAIAAAGGSLSFLGGYLSGVGQDDNQEDKEWEKLLKIKQDLSDLLKQAREDAIYYENTVRHKKAISANDEFTQRNVHDAIITPRGEVVNTDPKDYLIATKTPRSLVGGGAPTINFSVVDKSAVSHSESVLGRRAVRAACAALRQSHYWKLPSKRQEASVKVLGGVSCVSVGDDACQCPSRR